MSKRREPRSITLAEIEQRFELGAYWFGDKWCPAVVKTGRGYRIRVVKSETLGANTRNTTYDYFDLDADGLITVAPRGYARDYKPGRVVDIAAAVERYATPDPEAKATTAKQDAPAGGAA